jgi:hypothetical protein
MVPVRRTSQRPSGVIFSRQTMSLIDAKEQAKLQIHSDSTLNLNISQRGTHLSVTCNLCCTIIITVDTAIFPMEIFEVIKSAAKKHMHGV